MSIFLFMLGCLTEQAPDVQVAAPSPAVEHGETVFDAIGRCEKLENLWDERQAYQKLMAGQGAHVTIQDPVVGDENCEALRREFKDIGGVPIF